VKTPNLHGKALKKYNAKVKRNNKEASKDLKDQVENNVVKRDTSLRDTFLEETANRRIK